MKLKVWHGMKLADTVDYLECIVGTLKYPDNEKSYWLYNIY